MILIVALRSLGSRPVRTAVLAGGFGLGVAVMAALLGVAAVILEQARAPALTGGGDVIVDGISGRLANARFVLSSVLHDGPLADRVAAAVPIERSNLYLIDAQGVTAVRARGGVPSLDRALDDPEIRGAATWLDTPADVAWAKPDPGQVLLAMDRFHPIPDVPERAGSWAEWLYFNGRSGDARFYLTFLAGPRLPSGRRTVGVRLQLERAGSMTSYSDSAQIDETDLLASAPNLTVGSNRVRLTGPEYRISIDLPSESGRDHASGDLVVRAVPGRSLPPLTIRGAGGWLSGYVVPVMSGGLRGAIRVGDDTTSFDDGVGYHDHNWGFWEGVSWQWGQAAIEDLSFVYGRVLPPADAADPSRVPAFLMALGPEGPVGYATDVTIVETNRPGSDVPERIVVRGRSESLSITLDLDVPRQAITRSRTRSFGAGDLDFLQMRADYHIAGRVGGTDVDARTLGSAETFRGR
jgi:hypothetical protein